MKYSKIKIYYFYSYGELIESVEENSLESAMKNIEEQGYKRKEIDFIVEYDKKFGSYFSINPTRFNSKQRRKFYKNNSNYNEL